MPLFLILFFPFLEIYLLYQAAMSFGFVNLIFFLLVKGIIGKIIIRGAALQAPDPTMQPQKLISTAALSTGGLLLALPLLITSAVGALILFPPTRWLLLKFFKNRFQSFTNQAKFKVFNFNGFGTRGPDVTSFSGGERDVTPQIIDVRPIQKTDKKSES